MINTKSFMRVYVIGEDGEGRGVNIETHVLIHFLITRTKVLPGTDIRIYGLELPGLWLLLVVEADEGDAAPVCDARHELVGPCRELRLAPPHGFCHLVTESAHAAHGPVETWSSDSDDGDSAGVHDCLPLSLAWQLMSLCVVGLLATCHSLSSVYGLYSGQLPQCLGRQQRRGGGLGGLTATCNDRHVTTITINNTLLTTFLDSHLTINTI